MAGRRQFEFFVLRYVPDAVKEEFVNIGIIMKDAGENGNSFSDVRLTRDWRRVRCFDPQVDVEMLDALEREIRGDLGRVDDSANLLRRLQDSFSNAIEVSPGKACLTENPEREIEVMASLYLETAKIAAKKTVSGRMEIVQAMRDAFYGAGLRGSVMEKIPVAPYTRPGDPLKFDFGYRVGGEIKLFHAVSMKAGVGDAVMLAARYPKIAPVMARMTETRPELTAVIDDDVDRGREEIQFALGMMEEERIRIAAAAEMPGIAEVARVELGV